MKVVIVEDEFAAARSLSRLLKSIDSQVEVITVLQNVDESIEWFSTNAMPDVVFMDIHLADGDSFSIFKSVEIRCPIIFTTAYDQYALKAFEVNSIDYLLKPISKKSLETALTKLKNFLPNIENDNKITELIKSLSNVNKSYRKSFLIPFKDKLIPVLSDNIAYVYAQNKKSVITCFNKEEYVFDSSLDEFTKQLDPDHFIRANRQFIVSHRAVSDITIWFDGKLSLNISIPIPEKIIVSRARATDFKKWYMKIDD